MTHILSIIHYPVFGGPHNRNMRLAPILAQKGVRTTVLLPEEPGNAASRLRRAGVDVIQLPLRRIRATRDIGTHLQFLLGFAGEIRAIRKLIRRLKIDMVQLNGLANPHGALAARAEGIPVVWQILDTYTPMSLRRIMSPLVRRYADSVMCTGQRVAEAHPGVTKRPELLINFYPPVDTSLFRRDPKSRASARQELEVEEGAFVVGTIGNVNMQKGHDNFIRAAAHVKSTVPDAKFVIFGATHENHSDYVSGLWSLAEKLGLERDRDLIFLDPTGRVHELAQVMDVFWMTPRPRSEGIPTAIEEAMALELPVVSFNVGSIGELVEHGRSGYLIDDQDPVAIAEHTLTQLLDPISRATMGDLARRFVEQNASLDICADLHIQAYELARQHAALPVSLP